MSALRWVPGMREASGALCIDALDGKPTMWLVDGDLSPADDGEDIEPDDDEGTIGHIAAQARKAWGRPHLCAVPATVQDLEEWDPSAGVVRWFIRDGVCALTHESEGAFARLSESEGEAWIACLEAAP